MMENEVRGARKGEKRGTASVPCVSGSWERGERCGNVVFVEFRRRRERGLIDHHRTRHFLYRQGPIDAVDRVKRQ